MEWNNNEEVETKSKGMNLSSKILICIILCMLFIIILLSVLLMNAPKQKTFSISVDGKKVVKTKEQLLTLIDNITYVNIEEFAKIVGYEYHSGEYKSYVAEADKCYVEGRNETASFYLNDNKVFKLPLNKLEEEYEEYSMKNANKDVNGKIYAPIDTISKAFNVIIDENSNYFNIFTLDHLVKTYDKKVVGWGYKSIAQQSFENNKALLYGYLIVQKEGSLYKIIDLENTKEIVLARYSSIEFSEHMQEFYVKNSSNEVGVINLDGTIKVEPRYEMISILNKDADLYLIKKEQKYGVVKGGNITIIFPEYDSIGLNEKNLIVNNKYLLLDTLIPVCKEQKWGAYNKNGEKVLDLVYDEIGYNLTSIEINGRKESVKPIVEIERANGIVVKQGEKYGLVNLKGEILVPIEVDGIYVKNNVEDSEKKYFMLYNGRELNVIERLIIADKLEEEKKDEDINDEIANNTESNDLINNDMNGNIQNLNNNMINTNN